MVLPKAQSLLGCMLMVGLVCGCRAKQEAPRTSIDRSAQSRHAPAKRALPKCESFWLVTRGEGKETKTWRVPRWFAESNSCGGCSYHETVIIDGDTLRVLTKEGFVVMNGKWLLEPIGKPGPKPRSGP